MLPGAVAPFPALPSAPWPPCAEAQQGEQVWYQSLTRNIWVRSGKLPAGAEWVPTVVLAVLAAGRVVLT